MKKLLFLFLLGFAFVACEKEDEDPYGNPCEAATGQLCTVIGEQSMSGPAIWRRIPNTNRFRIDFQSGTSNLEIDIYVPDSVLYGNTYEFGSSQATGTAVMTFFDGTSDWLAEEGNVTVTSRANDLLEGTFQGKLKKPNTEETKYVKASSFNKIPLGN